MEQRDDVVLIGPIRAGKSTMGRLLSESLEVPQISMDERCWSYYREVGFVRGSADSRGPDGMIASHFIVHAVKRLLEEHRSCVFDMGAGHTVFRDEASLSQVKVLFEPYPNVILLLPSPDPEECSTTLSRRNQENEWLTSFSREAGYNPNEHFLRHASNFTLARKIVYTEGKSPEETRDEILGFLERRPERQGDKSERKPLEEIVKKLEATLEDAREGRIRSLALIAVRSDQDHECWTRITDREDSERVSNHLSGLMRDLNQ